ncbi:MAG: STAS domain-containing protein [Acidimicrobiia bacterium]|nr:STAS domain-containing protein [Acidimicrobiia bacterium]MYG59308.1 STAS domain-containing protein [Acidimicrobiia bacterium]MYJ32427.1 STAS domain-containing protein [Acidimicrobiia bacterium]
MEFGVTVASHKGWEVLTVTGEIDMATAPRFRQRLFALISGGAQNVVIDLSGVDYIDSTGLGVLMGGAKRVRSTGGDIRLVTTGSRLADLIELTRLDRVLDVFDSVSAATESSDS